MCAVPTHPQDEREEDVLGQVRQARYQNASITAATCAVSLNTYSNTCARLILPAASLTHCSLRELRENGGSCRWCWAACQAKYVRMETA